MKRQTYLTMFGIAFLAVQSSCIRQEQGEPVYPGPWDTDYRKEFTGAYDFTVVEQYWIMGLPTTYDTTVYSGSVNLFVEGDNLTDLSSFDLPGENEDLKVTIEFLPGSRITPEILESGEFLPKAGYHYSHSGSFLPSDSVQFSVSGLGGLGGGTNYFIRGKKH